MSQHLTSHAHFPLQVRRSSGLGGLCSMLALLTVAVLTVSLVVRQQAADNVLVSRSLVRSLKRCAYSLLTRDPRRSNRRWRFWTLAC